MNPGQKAVEHDGTAERVVMCDECVRSSSVKLSSMGKVKEGAIIKRERAHFKLISYLILKHKVL